MIQSGIDVFNFEIRKCIFCINFQRILYKHMKRWDIQNIPSNEQQGLKWNLAYFTPYSHSKLYYKYGNNKLILYKKCTLLAGYLRITK